MAYQLRRSDRKHLKSSKLDHSPRIASGSTLPHQIHFGLRQYRQSDCYDSEKSPSPSHQQKQTKVSLSS